jgi:voltage-gated potassium channel Kch
VLSGAVRIAQRIAETAEQPELTVEMGSEASVDEPEAPPLAAGEAAVAHATGVSGALTRSMSGRSMRGTTFSLPRVSGEAPFDFSSLTDHVILVGYGRVGTTVGEALTRAGIRYVIVEERGRTVAGLRKRGELAVYGDATRPDVLERAGIGRARLLVVTAPDPIRARRIVEVARAANPRLAVAVRTHSATEQQFFEQYLGTPGMTGRAVYAEREAALSLAHFSLLALGRTDDEADTVIDSLRGAPTRPTETFAAMPTTEFEAFLRASEATRLRRRATTTTVPPPDHSDDPPRRVD